MHQMLTSVAVFIQSIVCWNLNLSNDTIVHTMISIVIAMIAIPPEQEEGSQKHQSSQPVIVCIVCIVCKV